MNLSLTQEMLAERLGITKNAVSTWENGRYIPDLEDLVLICQELGVSIDYLATGIDSKTGAPKDNDPLLARRQKIINFCRPLDEPALEAIEAQAKFHYEKAWQNLRKSSEL